MHGYTNLQGNPNGASLKGASVKGLIGSANTAFGNALRANVVATPHYNDQAAQYDTKHSYADPLEKNTSKALELASHVVHHFGSKDEFAKPPVHPGIAKECDRMMVWVSGIAIIVCDVIAIIFAFIQRPDAKVAITTPKYALVSGTDTFALTSKLMIKYDAWLVYVFPLAISIAILAIQNIVFILWQYKYVKWLNPDVFLVGHSVYKAITMVAYAFAVPILTGVSTDFLGGVMIAAVALFVNTTVAYADVYLESSEWMNKGYDSEYMGRPEADYNFKLFRCCYVTGHVPKNKRCTKFLYFAMIAFLWFASIVWVFPLFVYLFIFYTDMDTGIFSLFLLLSVPLMSSLFYYLCLALYYNQFVSSAIYDILNQFLVHGAAPGIFMAIGWWYYSGGDSALFHNVAEFL